MSHFNSYVRAFDRGFNITVAIASSTSIGGWLIWQQIPYLWASILAIAQIVNIVKPFLPYLKDKEQLAETYIFYETIHVDYEKLWTEYESSKNESEASEKYFKLKDKELIILDRLKNIRVNNYKKIEKLARPEWADYLLINYNVKAED